MCFMKALVTARIHGLSSCKKWRARVCLIKTVLFEFISVVHLPIYRSSLQVVSTLHCK